MPTISEKQYFYEIIQCDIQSRDVVDDRTLTQKVSDLASSALGELDFLARIVYRKYLSANTYPDADQLMHWNKDSEGLAVFIHGLRAHPAIWDSQLHLLKDHKKIDTFAPFVPKTGMCSLEEAATPILSTILNYTRKHPGKPICLIGVSNGSRIATYIETKLRELSPRSPVKISTIAGVHLGSSRINQIRIIGQWVQPELCEELAYESSTAVTLLNKVRETLTDFTAERVYDFFATLDDFMVPNIDSSLPFLNKNEKFYVMSGVGHNGIVAAVAKQQINSCVQWIKNHSEARP